MFLKMSFFCVSTAVQKFYGVCSAKLSLIFPIEMSTDFRSAKFTDFGGTVKYLDFP